MWRNVRRGREEHFPLPGTGDVMVNTALLYELAVLKPYSAPVGGFDEDNPYYTKLIV